MSLSRYLFPAISASLAVFLLGILVVFLCDIQVKRKSSGKHHHSDSTAISPHRVALVLGCSETLSNGRSNLYFRYRIDAAVEAYLSGKCRKFLLSGDNGRDDYNEPEAMKRALLRNGVPESAIHLDYAGFRTLDSVVRAKEVFGQSRLLVISQQFHNERAIYIAQHNGMELTGINAKDVNRLGGWKTKAREKLARVKTILDVHLFSTKPKFLGSPILLQ